MLTLGACPEALYQNEYGEKTLRDREESGSLCTLCAEKGRDFLLFAQEIYDQQFNPKSNTSNKSNGGGSSTTGSTESGNSPNGGPPLPSTYNPPPSCFTRFNAKEWAEHAANSDTGMVCLSLDGGGMRGLVSIVCLLFASRRALGDESLTQLVDWYVGCSTGAMLALGEFLKKRFF